jgi:phosphoglycolate phosphatase-like HAD superfamily hydrolase
MEDAPAKPDPAPVRLALERLGVQRAWMLGDTPDDLVAAKAAGVLPVGVVPPGEESESSRATLDRAGAWCVLPTTEKILEVLP